MNPLDQILNWEPLSRIRRNHALEHATLQILALKNPQLRMAGYSNTGGFWVLGDVPLEDLQQAVDEAQQRLRSGEKRLAIHPYCGTNFVTTGLVAGSFAWLAMLGGGRGRDKWERWPVVVMMVTLAMILSQPLGPMVQQMLTTEPDLGSLKVTGIQVFKRGETPVQRVTTRF